MNIVKLISLGFVEFVLMLIIALLSINITQDTSLIFNPTSQLTTLLSLTSSLLLVSILGGLIVGVVKDIKLSLLFALTSFLGYLIGMITIFTTFNNMSLLLIQLSLILIGLLLSFTHFNSEMKDSIHFKIGRLTVNSFKTFFTFFTISTSIIFYMFNSTITMKDILTDELLDKFVTPVTTIIENQVNKQITSQINDQINTLNIDLSSNLNNILPLVTDEVQKSISKTYSDKLDTQNIGVTYDEATNTFNVTGLSSIVKPMIISTVDKYTKPYEKYIPMAITILFYLTLTWILAIFRLLTRPLAFIIEIVLLKLGYIIKKSETIEVERITL